MLLEREFSPQRHPPSPKAMADKMAGQAEDTEGKTFYIDYSGSQLPPSDGCLSVDVQYPDPFSD